MKNTRGSSTSFSSSNKLILIAILVCVGFALMFFKKENQAVSRPAEAVLSAPIEDREENKAEPKNDNTEKPAEDSENSNSVSRAEFEALAASIQRRLPLTADLQRLSPSEVHSVPALIHKAGDDLGLIAQALHDNAHLAAPASEFYQTCFSRHELPDQVRALCLANDRRLRFQQGDKIRWTEREQDLSTDEVRRLAEIIPI